ncbi:MAG: PIN domain-containing protein [Chthoniobacterales bacterium]|nr:PIN domain-containing protein [Chthoniobacterales bacterium]
MHAVRFLDTNILLYAYDLDAVGKRDRALELVEEGWNRLGETAISVQVLQELHVNLERRSVTREKIHQIVRDYSSWPVVENTLSLMQAGLAEQARWQLSLWDSMILAAARVSGASELITEDFSHGQDYGGIKVINPFV